MALSGSMWCYKVKYFPGTCCVGQRVLYASWQTCECFAKSHFSLEVTVLLFACYWMPSMSAVVKQQGLMSRAEQVTVTGVCQHWPMPCHGEHPRHTHLHVCKSFLHLRKQSWLHRSSVLSQASPFKIAYWV